MIFPEVRDMALFALAIGVIGTFLWVVYRYAKERRNDRMDDGWIMLGLLTVIATVYLSFLVGILIGWWQ